MECYITTKRGVGTSGKCSNKLTHLFNLLPKQIGMNETRYTKDNVIKP
jgi:hypothetical protein